MAFEAVGLQAVFETDQFTAGLNKYLDGIDRANSAATSSGGQINKAGEMGAAGFGLIAGAAASMAMAVVNAVGQVISKVAQLPGEIVTTGISVESAFAGVLKTTDNLVDGFGHLTALGEEVRKGFRDLAMSTPTNLEDLMNVGALAGQLGIADDQIVGFTKSMAALGVSTNLTSEEAASAIAKLQNIFKVSAKDMSDNASRFGSVIVDLGNNFATTEKDIMDFALRIGGAGKIAGLTQAQVAGIGAALSSVGSEAEAGGTAVQKVLLAIHESVITGNKDFALFAQTAGMTTSEFKKAWEEDAGGAFTKFVEGLGKSGDDAILILQKLGLDDQRLIRSFLSLSGAGDLLARTMDTSSKAWEDNLALTKEAQRRYETTESKIRIMENALRDAGLTIADKLLPFLNPLVEKVGEFIKNIDTSAVADFADHLGTFFSKLQEGAFAKELLPALGLGLDDLAKARNPDFSWLDSLADKINNLSSNLTTMLSSQSIGQLIDQMTGGNEGLSTFFKNLAGDFELAGTIINTFVQTIVQTVGPSITSIINSLTETLAKFGLNWDDVWNALGTGVTVVLGIIVGVIGLILAAVVGLASGIARGIATAVEGWNMLADAVNLVLKGVVDVISGFIGFWKSIFEGRWNDALLFAEKGLNGWLEIATGIFDAIVIGLGTMAKTIYEILAGFVDGVSQFFTNLYNNLVGHSIVPDIIQGILDEFTNLVNSGPQIILDFVNKVIAAAQSLGGGLMSAIFGGGGGTPGTASTDPVSGAFATIQTAFDTLVLNLQTGWTNLMTLFTTSIATLLPTFQPFVDSLTLWLGSLDLINVSLNTMIVTLGTLAVALGTAGATASAAFTTVVAAAIATMIAGLFIQFDNLSQYWYDTAQHMVGHWLNFVAQSNTLTAEFVATTIAEFNTLHEVSVGYIHGIRDEFAASMSAMGTNVSGTLVPALNSAGSAFASFKSTGVSAASAVAAAFHDVCAAAKEAEACITGSPELRIQHPFEKFIDFMKQYSPQIAKQFDTSILGPAEQLQSASAGFATSINRLFDQVSGTMMNKSLAAVGGGSSTTQYNYTIGPNYQQPQAAGSVIDDLVLMDMLSKA